MSNHIAAKFLGINYSPIPQDEFQELTPKLISALRSRLPRRETPAIRGIKLNVGDGVMSAESGETAKELHMVDAEGLIGIKIGNQGISLSSASYVAYDEILTFLSDVMSSIVSVVSITHYSRITLRNINLFPVTKGETDKFEHIRKEDYWGRQSFDILNNDFTCAGAATRHEYFSNDFLKHIQLSSSVVLPNQSHIPESDWDIWKLRGGVPTAQDVQLLIDICGAGFVAPVNNPATQGKLATYNWESVRCSFDELHKLVNSVYDEITKD